MLARQQVINKSKTLLQTFDMATATARFSSTTGDGWIRSNWSVRRTGLFLSSNFLLRARR